MHASAYRACYVPLLIGVFSTAIATAQPATAATFAVDDSTSYTHDANTAMKWKLVAPSRRMGSVVEGATLVTVRLNLMPWANKSGKIYMALPAQSIGPVKAAWTTQGRLLAGQLISGDRTLVYAGPIRTAVLEDTIALKVEADGQRLVAPQRLQFSFEIDVD
jgi:hypothetical protein